MALQSSTPSIVDAALRGLPTILPVLDFSTIKNELFPVVATIFSRTNSLAIKVRGLQAFVILCGGSSDQSDDGLNGLTQNKKTSSSTALDKYTMQEKIMPLIKAIKTKEPAVMIAALNVCRVVGQVADADFVAMDILPTLWHMSLGPLLNLEQFRQFMDLIKSLSARVEEEQTRKLQELGQSNGASMANEDFMSFGAVAGTTLDSNGATEDDFESLVKGKTRSSASPSNPMDSWDTMSSTQTLTSPAIRSSVTSPAAPAFSWSTPSPTTTTAKMSAPTNQFASVKSQQTNFRTVTPDLGHFAALTPSSTQFSQPLQPSSSSYQTTTTGPSFHQPSSAGTSLNWGTASAATSNPWASPPQISTASSGLGTAMSSMSLDQRPSIAQNRTSSSSFSLPPPPATSTSTGMGSSGFALKPPPVAGLASFSQQPIITTAPNRPSISSAPMGSMMSSMSAGAAGMNSMNSMMGGTNVIAGSMNSMMGMAQKQQQPLPQRQQPQKSGLDKYASLL